MTDPVVPSRAGGGDTEGQSTDDVSGELSPLSRPIFDWSDPLTKFGVCVSTCWTVASIVALWAFADWSKKLPPNEWGDLAAGFAAPLAFFWLVLGFLQQGKELRLSSRALMLQVTELKSTVKHQADLAQATKQQVEMDRKRWNHEQYDRRFRIYEEFRKLFSIAMQKGDVPLEDLISFRTSVTEADFLFGPEIMKYVADVYHHAVELGRWNDEYRTPPEVRGPDFDLQKVVKSKYEELRWLTSQHEPARLLFKRYLDLD